MHTADNYHRIAGLLQGQRGGGHTRIAKLLHRHGEDKHQDDGQRTLEQIVTNLLNHQSRQLNALKAAIA
jgi:hypothetical protein